MYFLKLLRVYTFVAFSRKTKSHVLFTFNYVALDRPVTIQILPIILYVTLKTFVKSVLLTIFSPL